MVRPWFIVGWILYGLVVEAASGGNLRPDGTYSVCPDMIQSILNLKMPPAYVSFQSKGWFRGKEVFFIDSDTTLWNPGRNLIPTASGPRLVFRGEQVTLKEMNFVVAGAEKTLALDHMHPIRHPNMIGGVDPKVWAGGTMLWRDGLIYEIRYRQTGHFKTGPETKKLVIETFKREFPESLFHPHFRGYVENENTSPLIDPK